MIDIYSVRQMRDAESFTNNKLFVSYEILMERAAYATFEEINKRFDRGTSVLVIAGTGNNGADGLALARILYEHEYNVSVCLLSGRESELRLLQKQRLEAINSSLQRKISFVNDLNGDFDLYVDAVFGIGLNRPVTGELGDLIESINEKSQFTVSIDIPSGLNGDNGSGNSVIKADLTVCLGYYKKGLFLGKGPDYTGEVVLEKIGIISDKAENSTFKALEYDDLFKKLRKRHPVSHKGTYGKTLIIGGSEDIYGAAFLCAKASFSCGAGMVKVFTHLNNIHTLQKELPEAMLTSYEDYIPADRLIEDIGWADTICIGPGIGTEETGLKLLSILVSSELDGKIIIIDADAINLFSANKELFFKFSKKLKDYYIECVMTPHKKELMRLKAMLGFEELEDHEALTRIFNEHRIVTVNKDSKSRIYGENNFINLTGNPGMATAGSGDVLAGILAGLLFNLNESLSFEEAVALCVYFHGLIGDRVSLKKSETSMTAQDMVEEIPKFMVEGGY